MLNNGINKISGTKSVYESMVKDVTMIREKLDSALLMSQESVKNEMRANMSEEEYAKWEADLQRDIDNYEDNLSLAEQKAEDAHKQFLKSWEDALSRISDIYNTAVKNAARTFEESFSPYFNTLELLQAQFEREKALEDYYVDDYQRIHDLSALDRSIQESILDTDNLKSKARLRDLQAEIIDLQEQGTELSEYDLDVLEKKYQLELARQALEDAKEAKSLVRLSRDNNGNWSYVYTSNDSDISEAEQDYENAIRSMEEMNENYIENLESQIIQVQQSAEAAMTSLNPDDFTNIDDYWMAIKSIKDGAEETMRYLSEQMNNAFQNNLDLDTYIIDRFGQNNHNLTTTWGDMTLAVVSGINSLDQAVNLSKDNLDTFSQSLLEAYEQYSAQQKEVYETAGSNLENATEYFDENMDIINQASDDEINTITKMVERMETSFEETLDTMVDFIKKYYSEMYDITNQQSYLFLKLFHQRINELMEISGEYVPAQQLNYTSPINTEFELNEIMSVLKEYGEVIVTDFDTRGNRRIYDLVQGTEETAAQLAEWRDAITKRDAIDVGEDLDTQDEYDKINSYLEAHGQVYIEINGELKKLVKDNEEDQAWLQEKLDAIKKAAEEASKPVRSYISDYSESRPGKIDWDGGGFYTDASGTVRNAWGTDVSSTYPGQTSEHLNRTIYGYDTGGYTGIFADTGMYTGEWPNGSVRRNGRLAWLHQKELVLNAHDTENFLDAMGIVRQLDNLTSWMANGLGDLFSPNITTDKDTLQQEVHIDASFPNVTDHNEIEEAFGNLVNLASQYANRKAFA